MFVYLFFHLLLPLLPWSGFGTRTVHLPIGSGQFVLHGTAHTFCCVSVTTIHIDGLFMVPSASCEDEYDDLSGGPWGATGRIHWSAPAVGTRSGARKVSGAADTLNGLLLVCPLNEGICLCSAWPALLLGSWYLVSSCACMGSSGRTLSFWRKAQGGRRQDTSLSLSFGVGCATGWGCFGSPRPAECLCPASAAY